MNSIKRIAALVLCIALLSVIWSAGAEVSSDAVLQTVYESVVERSAEQRLIMTPGMPVETESGVRVTLEDCRYAPSDTPGCMTVYMFVTADWVSEDADICLSDYDFMLLTDTLASDGGQKLRQMIPVEVYDVTDDRDQGLMWPVNLYADKELQLMLSYTVPKSTRQLAFVYTNMMGGNDDGVEAMGGFYDYEFIRGAADFNLINQCGETVTGVNAAPSGAKAWSEELLAQRGIDKLENSYWTDLTLVTTAYAANTDEAWSLRVTFEDGNLCTFSGLNLSDVINLTLNRDEDGKYALFIEN